MSSQWDSKKGSPKSGGAEGLRPLVEVWCRALSPTDGQLQATLRQYVDVFSFRGSDVGEPGDVSAETRECPPAANGLIKWRVVPPTAQEPHRAGLSGRSHSPDERGQASKAPRKRRAGRRGPEPFDVDYYLRRLLKEEVKARQKAGDAEREIDAAALLLKQKSAEQLAEEIGRRLGRRISGKTVRRNSTLYAKWAQFREGAKAPKPVDLDRRPPRKTPPRTKAQIAEEDATSGQLSQRQGLRGSVRGRSPEERHKDAEADDFLRKNGIDPSQFPAE